MADLHYTWNAPPRWVDGEDEDGERRRGTWIDVTLHASDGRTITARYFHGAWTNDTPEKHSADIAACLRERLDELERTCLPGASPMATADSVAAAEAAYRRTSSPDRSSGE